MIVPPPIETHPTPTLSAPPVAPQANELGVNVRDDRKSRSHDDANEGWFRPTVGFLASLTVHLLLLVILALLMYQPHKRQLIELSAAPSSDEPASEFDAFDFSLLEPDAAESEFDQAAELDLLAMESLDLDAVETPELLSIDGPPSGEAGGAQGGAKGDPNAENKPDISFFGTHGYGNRFVFVLDVSGSMAAGSGRRLRRAREEAIRAIQQLTEDHSFYVVLYSSYTIKMFGANDSPRLIPATAENKRRVANWIRVVRPQGGTMPGNALMIAGALKPDAVFFLSDGEFVYEGAIDPFGDFLTGFGSARPSALRPMNPRTVFPKQALDTYAPEIVVNTIALESNSSKSLMQNIAASKNGQFRFIPAQQPPAQRRRR